MEQYFRTARPRVPTKARRTGSPCRNRSVYPDASDPELSLLIRDYLQEFDPQNDQENAAVGSMVRAAWLTRCLRKLETELFSSKIRELQLIYPGVEYNTLLALAFSELAEEGGGLDFISRAEDHYDREYMGALRRLRRLREKMEAKRSEPNPGKTTEDPLVIGFSANLPRG